MTSPHAAPTARTSAPTLADGQARRRRCCSVHQCAARPRALSGVARARPARVSSGQGRSRRSPLPPACSPTAVSLAYLRHATRRPSASRTGSCRASIAESTPQAHPPLGRPRQPAAAAPSRSPPPRRPRPPPSASAPAPTKRRTRADHCSAARAAGATCGRCLRLPRLLRPLRRDPDAGHRRGTSCCSRCLRYGGDDRARTAALRPVACGSCSATSVLDRRPGSRRGGAGDGHLASPAPPRRSNARRDTMQCTTDRACRASCRGSRSPRATIALGRAGGCQTAARALPIPSAAARPRWRPSSSYVLAGPPARPRAERPRATRARHRAPRRRCRARHLRRRVAQASPQVQEDHPPHDRTCPAAARRSTSRARMPPSRVRRRGCPLRPARAAPDAAPARRHGVRPERRPAVLQRSAASDVLDPLTRRPRSSDRSACTRPSPTRRAARAAGVPGRLPRRHDRRPRLRTALPAARRHRRRSARRPAPAGWRDAIGSDGTRAYPIALAGLVTTTPW